MIVPLPLLLASQPAGGRWYSTIREVEAPVDVYSGTWRVTDPNSAQPLVRLNRGANKERGVVGHASRHYEVLAGDEVVLNRVPEMPASSARNGMIGTRISGYEALGHIGQLERRPRVRRATRRSPLRSSGSTPTREWAR